MVLVLEPLSLTGGLNLRVGAGTSLFAVDNDGVGIGSTANGFKLRVNGESRFSGSLLQQHLLEMVLISLIFKMTLYFQQFLQVLALDFSK